MQEKGFVEDSELFPELKRQKRAMSRKGSRCDTAPLMFSILASSARHG